MPQYRCAHCSTVYGPKDLRCPSCRAYEAVRIRPQQPAQPKKGA